MNLLETFKVALNNLVANRLRSGLAMLGIVIGVGAVISMISVSRGTQKAITESIERLGANLFYVWPKHLSEKERRQFSGRSKGLTYEDALALRAKIPQIEDIAPVATVFASVKYADKEHTDNIDATLPSYTDVRNFRVERGRFLTDEDIRRSKRVVVMGQEVAEKLFQGIDPLHKEVQIGSQRFVVVGILEKKGIFFGRNYDEKMFIPLTTAMRRFNGTSELDYLIFRTQSRGDYEVVKEEARDLLAKRHNKVIDFRIRAQEDFRRAREQVVTTFLGMIRTVAVISLIVGGIGIMNIMLVVVTERIPEIGLRKAVGATRGSILGQFLLESVTICVIGGLLGIVAGVFASHLAADSVTRGMSSDYRVEAVIGVDAIAIAFFSALIVGIVFGLYPAYKASKVDPIEALRHE